jgi:phosphoribosylformylglycinamidine cyclo-ligase
MRRIGRDWRPSFSGGSVKREFQNLDEFGIHLDFPAQTYKEPERIAGVSDADAYARAGVDQAAADQAVAGLVRALGAIELGRPSQQVPLPGHYASVIRIDERTGIALSTDGVGTKLLVAEQLGRFDTVGIDCVAMNVNDVICVGAEPLAMLDYIAIGRADPGICEQIGVGLARGAELAGIEIPGGELAQLGEMVRGFDVAGACFGTVALEEIVDGSAVQPGDAVIGLPSSGIHSNGYTLARSALEGLPLDEDPEGRLGRTLGEVLLEPTEIYVKPVLELLRSDVEVRGLAHITSGGLGNLLRLAADVGYEIDDPLPVPPIFELIQERSGTPAEEMRAVFNMGCGFCVVVPPGSEEAAVESLRRHYPESKPIGRTVEGSSVRLR